MCQHLTEQEEYVEGTTLVVALGSGVHEVVGSSFSPGVGTCQQTLSVPINNLSFVGKGEGETIVHGCFIVEGRKLCVAGLTVKSPTGHGLVAFGAATEMILENVTIEDCQNRMHGVYVSEAMTTARLTNCTSHHNKINGVVSNAGAVVDLMGEGTSVHDNEDTACTHAPVGRAWRRHPSTSTNLAFSMTCPTETNYKISA